MGPDIMGVTDRNAISPPLAEWALRAIASFQKGQRPKSQAMLALQLPTGTRVPLGGAIAPLREAKQAKGRSGAVKIRVRCQFIGLRSLIFTPRSCSKRAYYGCNNTIIISEMLLFTCK